MKTRKQPTAAATTSLVCFVELVTRNAAWTRRRVKNTKKYAKHVARDAFFWTWPLVNSKENI